MEFLREQNHLGVETSGSMIPPTRSDIEKKGQGNHSVQKTRSARSRKRMRISVLKLENAFLRQLLQGKKDENTLKTLRAGNADAADITRQEFRLLQAELREYGFRTEIAGYDALRLHTESRMLFADADSLRISPPRGQVVNRTG